MSETRSAVPKKAIFKDVAYSFGNFSGGIVSYAMLSWYMFFYVDKLGLTPYLFGWAMVFYGVWNALNDPLMGIISDKTRTRWGRRKPYMILGAVPLGVSLILLFSPPENVLSSQMALFVYFVIAICLFDTFFTMTMLAWSAVLPEMHLGESDRMRVNVYSQILGVLGALIATLAVEPIINAFGYRTMAFIFAGIGIVTMLFSAWGVREKSINMQQKAMGFIESVKTTFKNKAFLVCVTAVLLVETGKVFCTATIVFYSRYVMHSDMGVTILMGAMFVCSMIFSPVVYFLCKKIGVKNTYIGSTAIFALGSFGFFIAPSMVMATVVSVIIGMGISGIMIMPSMLYAQIIDEDQVTTGVRREGAFYGMNALVMRLSVIFHGFLSAQILSWTGYQSNVDEQIPSAVWGIRSLMGIVPLFFIALAIVVLVFYPINKERLGQIQEQVKLMNEPTGEETVIASEPS